MLYKIIKNCYINTDQVVSVDLRKPENMYELRFTFTAGYSRSFTFDSKNIAEQKLNDYVVLCNS